MHDYDCPLHDDCADCDHAEWLDDPYGRSCVARLHEEYHWLTGQYADTIHAIDNAIDELNAPRVWDRLHETRPRTPDSMLIPITIDPTDI